MTTRSAIADAELPPRPGWESAMSEQQPALAQQMMLQAFARLRPRSLGIACGLVAGAGLFAMTAILLLRGAWVPGGPIGPTLALLGHFFPGYAVTWPGAFLGLGYGFASGFAGGVVLALLFNFNHAAYLAVLRRRIRRIAIDDGL